MGKISNYARQLLSWLKARGDRADLDWFDRFMARDGGEEPAPEDR